MNTNSPRRYRLLKNIISMDLTAKAGEVGELKYEPDMIDQKVWFDNGRYYFYLSKIKNNPEWFELLSKIEVTEIRYHANCGVHGIICFFNSDYDHSKLPAIKQAIERVINEDSRGENLLLTALNEEIGKLKDNILYLEQTLEVNKTKVWDDSEMREFAAYYSLNSKDDTEFKLFRHFENWKNPSPLPKDQDTDTTVEWEILSFKQKSDITDLWVEYKNGWARSVNGAPATKPYSYEEIINNNFYEIHSVRRLSDNETFTVGDKVRTKREDYDHTGATIKEFKIVNGTLYVSASAEHWPPDFECPIEILLKLPQPIPAEPKYNEAINKPVLFTTEDGFPVPQGYDGEIWRVFIVPHSYEEWKPYLLGMPQFINSKEEKYFNLKSNAEQYILENKPCMSVSDLAARFPLNKEQRDGVINLAKEKIK